MAHQLQVLLVKELMVAIWEQKQVLLLAKMVMQEVN